jgi:hypothetical protein
MRVPGLVVRPEGAGEDVPWDVALDLAGLLRAAELAEPEKEG